ncbi:helix-turn-helix domain-containing protein [Pedobacter hiemivivus]|uniref:AraC family transcriptional regulator n=1 Tax=Pedobacter hiemivivus TaxID=2530454 RepID=A0A4R0N935_9SPHI|nr:AraC family transcriptional regulator [Pedobacter hiemivivus]TCC96555.1 AraC family transcriptional regulator [Pedobacter hiemivivus]
MENKKQSSDIVYSCYYNSSREGEHFVPEHTLSYVIAGSLTLNDSSKEYPSRNGTFRLIRRNQLIKFEKQPPQKGEFKSLSIYLNQQILKKISIEYGIYADHTPKDKSVYELKINAPVKTYINSLLDYRDNGTLNNQQLIELKIKEAILLLLQINPDLKNILFDFSEPHKIDLEAFMNKNYHFNVHLDRFAYLTGRSLATFKRDFEKWFRMTPGKWLLQKRLQEAYYLITQKGKKASDIYLDLGFEDLSHFSYAFKKQFGSAPSKISTE